MCKKVQVIKIIIRCLKNVSFIFTPCLYYKTQHVSVCKCIPNKAFKKSAFCMIASVTAYYRGINTPNFTCENRQKKKKKKSNTSMKFFPACIKATKLSTISGQWCHVRPHAAGGWRAVSWVQAQSTSLCCVSFPSFSLPTFLSIFNITIQQAKSQQNKRPC